MRRAVGWVAAIVLTIAGATVALLHRPSDDDPAQVVRDYLAALARSDAPSALALGAVAPGSHDLLTSDVLRAQNQVAALHEVHVGSAEVAGSRATVKFSYLLGFAAADEPVDGSMQLDRDGSQWRLRAATVPVRLAVSAAQNLATLAGAAVPSGPTQLFPGAVPITFASPYLAVAPDSGYVSLGDDVDHAVDVQVSASGETALRSALAQRLDGCFGARPGDDCPLPAGDRIVPGSLSGTIAADAASRAHFSVDGVGDGRIAITGAVTFTGTYQQLSFDNLPSRRKGSLSLALSASAAPVPPARIFFGGRT